VIVDVTTAAGSIAKNVF